MFIECLSNVDDEIAEIFLCDETPTNEEIKVIVFLLTLILYIKCSVKQTYVDILFVLCQFFVNYFVIFNVYLRFNWFMLISH